MTEITARDMAALKELIETRLTALEKLLAREVKALREQAEVVERQKIMQAAEYERRLDALNGEHIRIARNQETYVSREIWDRVQSDDATWKRNEERLRSTYVPRVEYDAYKDITQRALTMSAGQTQGISRTGTIARDVFVGLAAAAAMIVSIFTLLHR